MLSLKVDVAPEPNSVFAVLEEIGVSLHRPTLHCKGVVESPIHFNSQGPTKLPQHAQNLLAFYVLCKIPCIIFTHSYFLDPLGPMVGENRRLVYYQPMDFPSSPVQISNHRIAIRL